MPIETIAELTRGRFAGAPAAGKIAGWSIDSAHHQSRGDCFFALRGPVHDGHDFVAGVLERGAALAIVDHFCDTAAGAQMRGAGYAVALQDLGRGARNVGRERWWA